MGGLAVHRYMENAQKFLKHKCFTHALVAELVDAADSKPALRVRVRVPPGVL